MAFFLFIYILSGIVKFYGKEARNSIRAHSYAVDNIGLAHRLAVVGDHNQLGFFSQAFEHQGVFSRIGFI